MGLGLVGMDEFVLEFSSKFDSRYQLSLNLENIPRSLDHWVSVWSIWRYAFEPLWRVPPFNKRGEIPHSSKFETLEPRLQGLLWPW